MMQWIRANDRLPETDELVLAIASGRHKNIELVDAYELANYYAGDGWCLDAYPEMDDPSITHWMPLPDPPTAQDHLRDATKMMPRDIDADAPTIDPESLRQRGRWEKATLNGYLCCSACKDVYIYEDWLADGKWSFCPNCGAKMDKEMLESEVSEQSNRRDI